MDVLQVLSRFVRIIVFTIYEANVVYLCSADMEVRRKAMGIVLSMTSSRKIEEVALFLKQLQKIQEADYAKVCN